MAGPTLISAGFVRDGKISCVGHKVEIETPAGANPIKLSFRPGLANPPVVLLTPAVPGAPFIQDTSAGNVLIGSPPRAFHFAIIEVG